MIENRRRRHGKYALLAADVRKAARAGLLVAPVWFAANVTYNYSMSMTSITSTTVISSSSAAFTLILSVVWIRERLTALKVLGVLLCALGNVLTAVSDQGGDGQASWRCGNLTTGMNSSTGGGDDGGPPRATFAGDFVCVLSAMLYAWYTL